MTAAAFKKVVKQAIDETLLEYRSTIEEKIIEKIEDHGLLMAMKEVEHEKPVPRAEVLRVMRGKKR